MGDPTGDALVQIAHVLGLANDPELTPFDVADAVEQLVANANNPRDEPFIYRVADALGLARETATGSYLVRQIEQLARERDAFRDALDGALAPLVKRARKLAVDDYVQNDKGTLFTVLELEIDAFDVRVRMRSAKSGKEYVAKLPLDEPVTVLTPLIERGGLLLLRKELGAQLVDYARPELPEPDESDGGAA
jgi:hypothetical protein